jgi:hypothetical protein
MSGKAAVAGPPGPRGRPGKRGPAGPIGKPDKAAIAQERRDNQYYHVQDIIRGINQNSHDVKKWSVTSASIVAVVGQIGISNVVPVAALVALLAFAFWVTETVWRMNQWAFIRSLRNLEKDPTFPTISTGWSDAYYGKTSSKADPKTPEKSWSGFLRRFIQWETSLPHLLIILFAGMAITLSLTGILPADGEKAEKIAVEGPVHLDLQKR